MSNEDEAPNITFKERPHPQHAYRIVMTIQNAPGTFSLVEGSAQYDIANEDTCGKFNRVAGAHERMATNPPILWKKISDTEYSVAVYPDLMVDEDYYGRGVCNWAFTEARARLKATGTDAETRFVPAISAEEITAGQPVIWYFWKGGYPVDTPLPSNGIGFPDFGFRNPEKFKPELRDQLFSITLTPIRMRP